MLSKIFAAFGVIKELIALIRMFLKWRDDVRREESEKNQKELEAAIETAKQAKTEEEIWNAQERIVNNKPGS